MSLKGVHLLLTYRCDAECDHCFVWGSPSATGVMTFKDALAILSEAKKLDTVNYISIEGGEPFLFYPIMIKAMREALKLGFHVELLSNCYWATSVEDAVEWLLPVAETGNTELSLSSDLFHADSWELEEVKNAVKAAKKLGIPVGVLSVKDPRAKVPCPSEIEGAKVGLSELMYRGRAASKLLQDADKKSWIEFTKCPYEDLENPERVHVDPYGHVHVCQGISIGNALQQPFSEIIRAYDSLSHPIIGLLVKGGPALLVREFDLPHGRFYADGCHLCYDCRLHLKSRFPSILAPGQMYGEGLE
ncbi:radical SAM protein [Candidatus Bathyarchaeota archaeon]|nr:radical SAM protein [Candidatus Bathyarchaeota archaeon]